MTERLDSQIAFLREIDRLKQVFRQTYLMDRSRKENDAEHSWHMAMTILLLSEYAPSGIDVLKAVKMALVHDLVEIDAGDVICYDAARRAGQADRERQAAKRIFGLLPEGQGAELRALWEEFEARRSDEAQFAAACDRLQPILHNYYTQGAAWREHCVTADMVRDRNRHIGDASPLLWEFVQGLIDDAVAQGFLAERRTQ